MLIELILLVAIVSAQTDPDWHFSSIESITPLWLAEQ